jgi:hypothetical protein
MCGFTNIGPLAMIDREDWHSWRNIAATTCA